MRTVRFALAIVAAAITLPAQAASYPELKPTLERWSFAGPFGKFDPAQLQRGYQVYKEVCASCHSMELVAFRNLGQPGGPQFGEAEVRALAAEYQIVDGPNEDGDMFERPGAATDRLPSPFPNKEASAAANGGAPPPDLSLMAKARGVGQGVHWTFLDFFTQYQEGGVDYLHSLLTGYQDPPEGVEVPEGTYYNPYFVSGISLKMPPPLADDQVTYTDGSPQTVDQYSRDVSAFMMWAAEPHLSERKRMGFMVMIFLFVFAGLMYLTKKKVWANVSH
jgi:ubiquinol-cytochrome c reductase cytochrome c1 subunit